MPTFIDEEYDTNSNPFNNNVILLGTKGLLELDLMNKSRTSLRKDKDIIKKSIFKKNKKLSKNIKVNILNEYFLSIY